MSIATLTLHRLDEELTGLLDYRQQRVEDREHPAEPEELAACDTAIREYMEQLPRKVDGVAAVLRHFAEQADSAKREIARLRERKRQIEEDAQRLKDYAAAVLERQPLPAKGCRRLVGAHSTLMLKGNGSVEPLVIAQPELVPDEYCEWSGKLTSVEMDAIPLDLEWRFTRAPSPALVREALIQPCPECEGTGHFDEIRDALKCEVCNGTGRASVPGAYLGDRGSHIEIR